MYLSRIQLMEGVAEHSQLGLLLKDRRYGIHRLLWDLFGSGERFVFREESACEQLDSARHSPLYYVLSQAQPKTNSPIFKVESKTYQPALAAGEQLTFRLRANPTVARREQGKKHSSHHDVVMDAQYHWLRATCAERGLPAEGKKSVLQAVLAKHPDFALASGGEALRKSLSEAMDQAALNWLSVRGDTHGFRLDSCQATGYRWHALPEKGRNAGFSSMDYEGLLTVTDAVHFATMLAKGLGRSKAFGCGLMMVKRL